MSVRKSWGRFVSHWRARLGHKRFNALALLAITGVAFLAIHGLARVGQDRSALLYLAVPYSVAVLITLLRPYGEPEQWWQHYLSHSVSALVVFLATSVVLAEGFICVLFFMPIYFLGVSVAFIGSWISARSDGGRKTYSFAIPAVVALLSLEGTSEMTTLDRSNTATATAVTALDPARLLANLGAPFELARSDHWLLGLFPMPHAIEAGSLEVGDRHRVHTRYHRWFFTNTHEGEIELRIDAVGHDRVALSFTKDTSYFASYVDLHGSEIEFTRDANGLTRVSLTLSYERRLDPAWYFQPLQQYAMRAMAGYLIKEVVIRD